MKDLFSVHRKFYPCVLFVNYVLCGFLIWNFVSCELFKSIVLFIWSFVTLNSCSETQLRNLFYDFDIILVCLYMYY